MKKVTTINFIVFAMLLIAVFFIVKTINTSRETLNTSQANKQWNTLNHAQKEAWLNNYIENPDEDGIQLVNKMEKAIKSQLNFPSLVNFDHSPKFSIARVVEADSGLIDIENSGTLKNSSGIRQTFSYLCKLKITSVEKELKDVVVDIHD